MIIEDTCTKTCAYYKKYKMGGDRKICPHYMITTWASKERTVPKTVNDCSHKRGLILQIEAFNRMLGLQQASESERNTQHKLLIAVAEVAKHTPALLITDEDFVDADIKQIEATKDEIIS
jgi:hypothetical protein